MILRNPILAFALAICGGSLTYARSTTYGRAIAEVQNLAMGCEVFKHEHGQYPQPENWWNELKGFPDAEINTKGAVYIDFLDKKDPWNSDYQYMLLNMGSVKLPMVYSLGKDQVSKTFGHDPDDISSWRDYKIPLSHYQPPFFTKRKITIGTIVSISYMSLLLYLRSKRITDKHESQS